jgi:uncharacterized membrane protein
MEYQTRRQALPWMNLFGGVALGALAMYVADPSLVRRRRSLLQDKVSSATHRTSKLVNQTMRDAKQRLAGLQAEARRAIAPRELKPLDNHVLEARVRSRLGRAMPGLRGIDVSANEGVVTLSGQIEDEAAQRLLDTVAAIPGVESVRHELHATEVLRSPLSDMLAGRGIWWTAAAVGAGALTWYALSRRQPLGLIAAATGLGLMARSGAGQQGSVVGENDAGIEAQRTIDISAPPETVYDLWSHYENFPHFMAHVIEVRDLGGKRSHWVVQGPAGSEVEFESVLTAADRPSRLAWQSEPGSEVDTEGLVVLEPSGAGTRATVRIAWRPPAGSTGKALAMLTGVNPEDALEDDLQRMKQFIERGLPPGEGGATGTGSQGAAGSTGSTGGNVLH